MSEYKKDIVTFDAIHLLEELISIPSLSKEENNTADAIELFLKERNIDAKRSMNNVWCVNKYFDTAKPSILLNSHHDTVPPNAAYANDPYLPKTADGKLYGLGSTDAGASLVSLMAAFLYFYEEEDLAYNLVFAASAEEEISGSNGIEILFAQQEFKSLFAHDDSFAIVGEPTKLDLAVAEKGLLVLDCIVHGKAGHAAREEGDNAIYKAMKAIDWLKNYRFEKVSDLLGEVKMTVTSVQTENKTHNVVPATCSFVVDIRVTEMYKHEEILETIKKNIEAEIKPRSTRLLSSFIDINHPIVKAGIESGKKTYGSPTLSDQALIPLPSLKCGPGNSAQSHTADEFIAIADIEEGIGFYVKLLESLIVHS
jgi:acetylornithine deacetylase